MEGVVMEDDDLQYVYSHQATTHLTVYPHPTCGFTEGTSLLISSYTTYTNR